MKKIKKLASIGLLSLFLVGSANAFTAGLYVGGGLGVSKLDTKDHSLFDDKGWGSIESSIKQGGLSWKAFAGYNLNEYFGVELGYANYADSKASGTVVRNNGSFAVSRKNELRAVTFVGKAGLPLGETGISIYAIGGGAQVNSRLDYQISGGNWNANSNSISESKFRPMYGAGVGFAMNENWNLGLELTRIQGEGDGSRKQKLFPNADALMLSLAYQFN